MPDSKVVSIADTPFADDPSVLEAFTREQGGEWRPYLGSRGLMVHSLRTKTGREWDCINGWRDEVKPYQEPEAPPRIKVVVCTPVYGDTVKRGFWHSQVQAMLTFVYRESDVEKDIDLVCYYSSNLIENRHKLVAEALKRSATHILFWDADIDAPHDCIVKMVNHHLPIVAANYPKKVVEATPTAYLDTDTYVGPCWTQKQHTGLQAVSSCGLGLMLIDVAVFLMLEPPFFQFTQSGENGLVTITEDVFFCHKARAKGFDVVIDHDLSKRIKHIGDWDYTCEMADIARAAKQQIYRGMPTSTPDVPL